MENFSFEDALKLEDKALTRTCWKLGQPAKPDREKNIDSCFHAFTFKRLHKIHQNDLPSWTHSEKGYIVWFSLYLIFNSH